MLYGVASTDGAMFVLIVHSIQTLLVGVLGVLGVLWMMMTTRKVS